MFLPGMLHQLSKKIFLIRGIQRGFSIFPTVKLRFSQKVKGIVGREAAADWKMSSLVHTRPEGVLRNWNLRQYTVKDLESECEKGIIEIRKTAHEIATASSISYETVLKPLIDIHRKYDSNGTIGSVFGASLVAESEELRSVCVKLQGMIEEAFVDLEMEKGVYEKLVRYRADMSEKEKLSHEMKKCLDRLILNRRRSGLELSNEVQDKIKSMKNEMSLLSLAFSKNLVEENTSLHFEEAELKGMDPTFLSSLTKDSASGKYVVTLKYPHYIPVMKKCTVPETRRKMETAFNSRCIKENSEILEKLVVLREEHAKLLGYPCHAAYEQEVLMAANPSNVESFFNNLLKKVTPRWEEEKKEMLHIKKEECEKLGLEFDGKINMWDFSRFLNIMIDRKYSLDQDKLKEHFPLNVVLDGMFKIYQTILGLTFTLLPTAEVWNDDVTAHVVTDNASGEILGYFFLDLYPREGKYGHACCATMQQGCLDNEGQRQKSVLTLICNFPRPMPEIPSLLSHDDVETMFHEFGHGMHVICCRAETPIFFGTLVQRDFLEAPSQMLENWCFQKESLNLMSKHFKTGNPLPDDLINNLVNSKKSDGGAMTLRQIFLATVDQRIHREGRYNNFLTFKDTLKELMGLEPTPGTNMLASFGHLAGNYDARYYVYMWSLVFAEDMFETVFQNEGVLSREAGMKYRKCILEPGGSLDGMEMLKNFLGREPSLDPFLRSKGLI